MAFKGMNVSLKIDADTSSAKAKMQELQQMLSNLTVANSGGIDISKEINEGVIAAQKLQTVLQQATNIKTGKLNFNDFNKSLQQSGMTLSDYADKLSGLGVQGQMAFAKVAQSISQMQAPALSLGNTIKSLGQSLANVARYQISTGILNNVVGSIQQAFSYAQNLNKSLTDIQIVTGSTSEQMATFAANANKAAQSLSTTTNQYSKAALIFYQQGLKDADVEKRMDTVVKMMHATGDSAESVSSYMTAIWNNFDDGSESLAHYADVITALGASTASSSAEIAEGLSKFASIADTIGLSYDYATSALATLVANTRQSADVVGNSLKTIFARLQGLKLGETLEDGVSLNKYSAALEKVGVSVLDATGNIRNMDSILDDLAGKWENLSQAQQNALAQTVGGTRQYTQLISLMNNWDDMQQNLLTAQNSEGTLDTQQEAYAQSWEAARDRVQAAMEEIYSSLIDDQFFISLLNGFKSVLNEVNNIIKSIGGLKGVITSIGAIVTTVFQGQISKGLSSLGTNFQLLTGQSQKMFTQMRQEALSLTSNLIKDLSNPDMQPLNDLYKSQANVQDALLQKQQQFKALGTEIAAQDQMRIDNLQKQLQVSGELAEKAIANQVSAGQNFEAQKNIFNGMIDNFYASGGGSIGSAAQINNIFNDQILSGAFEGLKNSLDSFATDANWEVGKQKAGALLESLTSQTGGTDSTLFSGVSSSLKELSESTSITDFSQKLDTFKQELGVALTGSSTDVENFKASLKEAFEAKGFNSEEILAAFDNLAAGAKSSGESLNETSQKMSDYEKIVKAVFGAIEGAGSKIASTSQIITQSASSLMQFSTFLNTATTGIKTLFSVDATPMQKLTSVISLATTAIFLYNSAVKLAGSLSTRAAVQKSSIVAAFAVEKGAADQATASVHALTAAEAASGILKIIGLVLALVTVIASVFTAISEAQKKAKEAAQEAERARLDAEKNRLSSQEEENKANKSLLKSYSELYEEYQKTHSNQEQLRESAYALADAYNLVGASIALAANNFEKFNAILLDSLNIKNSIQTETKLLDSDIRHFGSNADTGDLYNTDTSASLNSYKTTLAINSELQQMQNNPEWRTTPDTWGSIFSPNQISSYNKSWWGTESGSINALDNNKLNTVLTLIANSQDSAYSANEISSSIINAIAEAISIPVEEIASLGDAVEKWNSYVEQEETSGVPLEDRQYTLEKLNLPNVAFQTMKGIYAARDTNFSSELADIDSILTGTNFSGLFDDNGNLAWNNLTDGSDRYDAFKTMEELLPTLRQEQEHLNEIVTNQDNSYDEQLVSAASARLAFLEQVIPAFEDITGNEDIKSQVEIIDARKQKLQELRAASVGLQDFFGKNENNTSFSEYVTKYNDLINVIKSNHSEYETLQKYFDENGKLIEPLSKEYEQAVQNIANQFLSDYTSFDDYVSMYSGLSSYFGGEELKGIVAYIDNNKLGLDNITPDFVAAVSLYLSTVADQTADEIAEGLQNNQAVKNVIAASTAAATQRAHRDLLTSVQSSQSLLKKDMKPEEAEALYNAYWGNEELVASLEDMGKAQLLSADSYTAFLAMSYSERQAYLQSITDAYLDTITEDANQLIKAGQQVLSDYADGTDDLIQTQKDGQYVVNTTKINGIQSLQSKFLSQYEEQEDGSYLGLDGTSYKDFKAVLAANDELKTQFDSYGVENLDDWNKLLSTIDILTAADNDITTGNNTLQWAQLLGSAADTAATNFNKLKSAISSLPTSDSDMSSLLKLLGDNGIYQSASYNGSMLEKTNWDAQSLINLYQNDNIGYQELMLRAMDAEIAKATGNDKAILQYQRDEAQKTLDQSEVEKAITPLKQTVNELSDQASLLQNIDIAALPKEGTSAYLALNKALMAVNTNIKAFRNMSSEDKIKKLGEARKQILTDELTLQKQIAEQKKSLIIDESGNEMSYEDAVTANKGQEWLDWHEAEQKMLELDDQLVQVDADVNKTIADMDATSLQAQIAEWDKLKTTISSVKSTLSSLTNDPLSWTKTTQKEIAELRSQFKQLGLDWASFSSAMNSGDSNIQTNALVEYYGQANLARRDTLITEQSFYDNISKLSSLSYNSSDAYATAMGNSFASGNYQNAGWFQGLESNMRAAINNAVSEGTKNGLSGKDLYQYIQQYFTDKKIELQTELDLNDAEFNDMLTNISSLQVEAEQEAANNTIEIWKSAYQTIAAAREKILNKEGLEFSDYSDFMKNYYASGATDMEQFATAVSTGNYEGLFNYNSADYLSAVVNGIKQSIGYDYLTNDNGGFHGSYQDMRADYARKQGWTEEEIANGKKENGELITDFDSAMMKYLSVLLQNKANSPEGLSLDGQSYTVDEFIAAIMGNGTNSASAWEALEQIAAEAVMGAETYAGYTSDSTIYTDATKAWDIAQAQFNTQNDAWSAIRDAILTSQENGSSIYDTLGESTAESYMKALNLTKEELNNISLDQATEGQETAAAQLQAAADTFSAAVGELGNIDGLDVDGQKRNEVAAASSAAQDNASIDRMKSYAEAVGMTVQEFESYANILNETAQIDISTKQGQKELADLALKTGKVAKGMESLSKVSTETWKTLKDSTKRGTKEYTKALNGLKKDMSNIFNRDMAKISDAFVEKHLEDMEKMANGTAKEAAAAKDAIEDDLIQEMHDLNEIPATVTVKVDGQEEAIDVLDVFKNQLDQWDGEEVGFTITADSSPAEAAVIDAMNAMLASGTMTASQITAALNTIGWEPEITYVPADVQGDSTTGIHYSVTDSNGGSVEWNGEVETSDDGHVMVPQLKSASKTSGPPSGGGRRGGGGGGGGGRRRERQQKRPVRYDNRSEKNAKDEIERYHHVTNALETISHELNMIEKAKDKAFGKDKLKAIDAETKALEKQKATQEEYLKEIQTYAESDAAAARSIGLEIDAEGHVTNYELKMTDWINDYNNALRQANAAENKAVDWWNSLSADAQDKQENKDLYEEKVEAAKRIAEVAQEEYDSRVGILNQYEETMDLLDKESETYQDIIDSIRSAMLEKIQYAVELKVEVNENALNILKDYLEDIGDKADHAADALANFAKQASFIENQVEGYQNGVQEILGLAGADNDLINRALTNELSAEDWVTISGLDLQADDVKTLEEYQQSLLSYNNTLRELRDKALAKVNDAFEEYNTQLAKNSEQITHLQTVNQTYLDIVDIVGKKILDNSGELTHALNKADFEMQRNNTHALKSQLEFIDESISATQKELDKARAAGMSEATITALEDSIKSMNEERDSVYESWLDSWEAECQAAATIYENTLANIIDTFETAIGGLAGSLSALQEEFNRQKTIDDTYLEEYDQIYQLSKLTRDINKSIDDTDNINSKKALKKLNEEINKIQEEGNDLSQYDLDVLRKKYELELAREELAEARDAKTAVRMVRDSEGNYGYVYTASMDEVEKAEQNYEDKLHEMQQLNSDYIDSMQEQILQAEADCSAALAELNASDYATYEEYQAAALKIQEDYGQLVEDYYSQLQNAVGNNAELYEGAWTDYSEATGYALDREKEFVTTFGETQLSILGGYNTIEDASIEFHNALAAAMNESCKAWAEWYATTQIALSDGGTSIQDYADDINDKVNGANGLVEAAQAAEEEAAKMKESFNTAFQDVLDALDQFLAEWDHKIRQQIETNQLLSETIYAIIAKAAGEQAEIVKGTQRGNAETGEAPVSAASGGYTGDWNSDEGKLAILHQKELILNADDTENILNAVDSVRAISNILDLNASSASAGLASVLQSAGVSTNTNNDTIEQTVSINAQFTDATTASEITEALNGLINKASQYANRTTR